MIEFTSRTPDLTPKNHDIDVIESTTEGQFIIGLAGSAALYVDTEGAQALYNALTKVLNRKPRKYTRGGRKVA